MPVLTRKQYKAEKVIAPSSAPIIQNVETSPDTVSREAVSDSRLQYVLMYPEIPANGARPSFDGIIDCEGIKKHYRCEDGLIRTTDKVLCDNLIEHQHILLETKEI